MINWAKLRPWFDLLHLLEDVRAVLDRRAGISRVSDGKTTIYMIRREETK